VYPSQQMFWNAMLRKGLNLISYDCKKIKIWTVFFYFFYPILMFIFMGYWWCIHINSNRVQNSDFFFMYFFFFKIDFVKSFLYYVNKFPLSLTIFEKKIHEKKIRILDPIRINMNTPSITHKYEH
jgi:hypothetical protein